MTHFKDCVDPRPFFRALDGFLTPQILENALARSHKKFRVRCLPAPLVLVILIANFIQGPSGLPRILHWLGFGQKAADISDQALYQARQRIGWRPLAWLRRHVVDWLAVANSDPTAFYKGRRLIGIDGTTLTTADTPDNERVFGKCRNQYNKSGFPLIRVLALCELGTHAFVRWMARSIRISEQKMSLRLVRHVPAGSLLIADRNFHNWKLWQFAKIRSFSMILRVKSGPVFPVLHRLPDGSFLSRILPRRGRNKKANALPVRVLDYVVTNAGHPSKYRLVTNLLDAEETTATELIALYLKRWKIEGAFGEFKSQLHGRDTELRSGHPLGVMAELDALLLGYYAVRRVALQAARREGVDPLSISFQQVLKSIEYYVLRPKMSRSQFQDTVTRRRNPERKRRCRRCKKVVRCAWPIKKKEDRSIEFEEVKIEIMINQSMP